MQKVVIENGKVVSVSGHKGMGKVIADLSTQNNQVEIETLSNETQNKVENSVIETTTENNDTKLPQTGEETNIFVKWLSIVITLGVFWLGSMLLIEYEKKNMKEN